MRTFEQNRKKLTLLAGKWRVDELFKILLFENTIKDADKQKMIIGLSAQYHSFIREEIKGKVDAPEKRKNDSRIADGILYVIGLLKEEDCNLELLNKQLLTVVIVDTEKEEEKLSFSNWLRTANKQVIITGLLLLPAFSLWLWAVVSSSQFTFGENKCTAMQVANFANPILQMLFSLFAMTNASLFRRFDVESSNYQENEENIKRRFLPSQALHFKDWLEFKKSSNIVVRQFVTYWTVSWGAWLTLYGLILTRNLIETNILPPFWGENTNSMIWILQDLCKNISTFTYFLMFYVLTMYVTDVSEDRQNRIFRERTIYAVGVAILFFLSLIHI